MKIRILAFASAAEALGCRQLEIELDEPASVRDLLDRLEQRAPGLAPIRARLAVAIDGQLVTTDRTLRDSAEVALLPPVSGGEADPVVELVSRPIDPAELSVGDAACGAEVLFLGRVRETSHGRGVTKITYEGYEAMAEARLRTICRDLSLSGARLKIVHRLGDVPTGELSVAIAARAPHRREAFEACARALERLKRETPIWKLEHYDDGSMAWREEEPLSPDGAPSSMA